MAHRSTGPGAVRCAPGTITLNADRAAHERISLVIVNSGDRPVQIGSHIHLPDVNPALLLRPDGRRRLPPRHPLGHEPPLRARSLP